LPLVSLKEKGQNSTIIQKLTLWLEETPLRAEDSHVLTTEGSLAGGKVRPRVHQCSGCRAVGNPGSLLQKKNHGIGPESSPWTRSTSRGSASEQLSPLGKALCVSLSWCQVPRL